ncbi:ecdysteroid kinase [Nitrosospira sp. Nsp2]|uniref:phosphotransferase n=1 Tax=Nitrosospira sp. Nsp2 TaxID=136548 RepID=UPI000D30BAE4|nr:phosphotransferase [Nitrosospira sp. Nsp2]PTR17375.1 ecdysteroid kinase [Nitrosospira sp. Nsp2]
MKQKILARRPSDLTIDWAQRVVKHGYPDVIVSDVTTVSVDIGTTTRVRLAIEHDGPAALPRRWFVKLPSLDWRARLITALPGLLHTEVRFYKEAAHAVPLAVPGFLAAQSKPGRGATLVLGDVTEAGATAGRPGDALTPAQATLVIEQLARFHAFFWNKVALAHTYRWLAGPVRRLEDHLGTALAVPLMQRGLKRAGKLVPAAVRGWAVRYARHRRQAMRFLSDGPQTLVHHDCHPGNIFWRQSQPGLLDWQLVRFGEGVADISYFLATALKPEVRRAHEARFLTTYAQVLAQHGITGIDPGSLWQRYRAHLAYPFEAMIVSLAVGGMIEPESNHELIRRVAAAVEDLDAFAAIPI